MVSGSTLRPEHLTGAEHIAARLSTRAVAAFGRIGAASWSRATDRSLRGPAPPRRLIAPASTTIRRRPHSVAPSSAASIAFSASDALAASGPPPCAMSGRPPPPLPPSAATPAFTRSTALSFFEQIVGDADHRRGLALLDADQRDHARTQLLLELVGHALEVLARHAGQHAADHPDAAHLADLVRRRGAAAARSCQRQRLARLGELALDLALTVDQRLQARRQILRPHLHDRRRLVQEIDLVAHIALPPRGRPAPRCGARPPTPRPRRRCGTGRCRRCAAHACRRTVRPNISRRPCRPSTARAPRRRTSRRTAPSRRRRSPPRVSSGACRPGC